MVIVIAYLSLLLLSFLLYLHPLKHYLLPLYLLAVPLLLKNRINIRLSFSDLSYGLFFSTIILVSFTLLFIKGLSFNLTPAVLIYQLFGVAFPEEVFFRGFLQDRLGNNWKALLIVSLLFSAAHLPALIFNKDLSAPLTFFPSLVMGFLYMRTGNLLPGIIFHYLSNLLFLSMAGFMPFWNY